MQKKPNVPVFLYPCPHYKSSHPGSHHPSAPTRASPLSLPRHLCRGGSSERSAHRGLGLLEGLKAIPEREERVVVPPRGHSCTRQQSSVGRCSLAAGLSLVAPPCSALHVRARHGRLLELFFRRQRRAPRVARRLWCVPLRLGGGFGGGAQGGRPGVAPGHRHLVRQRRGRRQRR